MVPLARNPRFVGRQDEIAKIEELIAQQNGQSKIAICGLGGIGKTQVALELAYRMRARCSEYSIFWIPCTSYKTVEQAYMSIAQSVGMQDVKPAEAKDWVKSYLSQKSAGKWLLIFDNADDMDMWIFGTTAPALKDFLPQNEDGRILFTTRNRKLAVKLASPNVISIPEPDKYTAMEILQKSLIGNRLLGDSGAATTLLEQLAFLPLAIVQAAAYINENDMGLGGYVALLQEEEADVAELLSEDFEDDGRYKDIQNAVATTWLISFQQIQRLDDLAIDYLLLMASINAREIPQSFLPQPSSMKKKNDAIGLLKAYNFVREQSGEGLLSLHPLVYLATRNWMRKDRQFDLRILKMTDQLRETFLDNNGKLWRENLSCAQSLVKGQGEFQRKPSGSWAVLENDMEVIQGLDTKPGTYK